MANEHGLQGGGTRRRLVGQAGQHAAELWSRQPAAARGRATWLAVLAVCDWNRTLVAAQNIFFYLHSTILYST